MPPSWYLLTFSWTLWAASALMSASPPWNICRKPLRLCLWRQLTLCSGSATRSASSSSITSFSFSSFSLPLMTVLRPLGFSISSRVTPSPFFIGATPWTSKTSSRTPSIPSPPCCIVVVVSESTDSHSASESERGAVSTVPVSSNAALNSRSSSLCVWATLFLHLVARCSRMERTLLCLLALILPICWISLLFP